MPDTDTNLVIRTQAELDAVNAARARLRAEIKRAKATGMAPHEAEIILKGLDNDNAPQNTNAPLQFGNGEMGQPLPETPPGMFGDFTNGLFGAIQIGIDATQQAIAELLERQNQAVLAATEKASATNATNVPPSGVQTNLPFGDGQGAPTMLPADLGANTLVLPPLPVARIPDSNNTPEGAFPGTNVPNGFAGTNAPPVDDGGQAAAQTQALQSSGERLRAALEQNSFMTQSLFARMLEVMDAQNRKLGDADRKISELGNQIKSLKNP